MNGDKALRVKIIGSPVDAWLILTIASWVFSALTIYAYMQPVDGLLPGDPLYYTPMLLPAMISGAMTWVVYDDAKWWRAARRALGLLKAYSRGVLSFKKPLKGSLGVLVFNCPAGGRCTEDFMEYASFHGEVAEVPEDAMSELELWVCRGSARGVLPAVRINIMGVDVYYAIIDENTPRERRRLTASKGSGGVVVVEKIGGELLLRAWPSRGKALLRYDCGDTRAYMRLEEPVSLEYPPRPPLILVAASNSMTHKRLRRSLGCLVAGKALHECKPELLAA